MSLLEGVETEAPSGGETTETTEAQGVAEQSAIAETTTTSEENETKATYLLNEDVAGEGESPSWFKSGKYKTVSDQAKAYTDLESKFGSFTGAPKDGKYEIEGIEFEDGTLFGTVAEWGAEKGLSNDGMAELFQKVGELSQRQIEEDKTNAVKELGADGDSRLRNLAEWGKNNLDEGAYKQFQGLAQNAGQVQVLEKLIGMTKNSKLVDKTEVEDASTRQHKKADLEKLQFAKDENGKRLMDVDFEYRNMVQAKMKEFYGN